MKEIKILNHDAVPVVFNMAAQIAYERISDKAFELSALVTTEARLVLYYSCILAADENTEITLKDLLENTTVEDIKIIDDAVNAEMSAWYHIPEPAKANSNGEYDTLEAEEDSPNL